MSLDGSNKTIIYEEDIISQGKGSKYKFVSFLTNGWLGIFFENGQLYIGETESHSDPAVFN
jgi:hypothetical protein